MTKETKKLSKHNGLLALVEICALLISFIFSNLLWKIFTSMYKFSAVIQQLTKFCSTQCCLPSTITGEFSRSGCLHQHLASHIMNDPLNIWCVSHFKLRPNLRFGLAITNFGIEGVYLKKSLFPWLSIFIAIATALSVYISVYESYCAKQVLFYQVKVLLKAPQEPGPSLEPLQTSLTSKETEVCCTVLTCRLLLL